MKKILIVEDNLDNLYLCRFILEKGGHQVLSVQTGIEGVAMALAEQPDLVLMDIQLPDINGFEATQRIREDEKGKSLLIIALTSYAMVGDREQALKAGCTEYIEKPLNPDTFLDQIEKLLVDTDEKKKKDKES